MTKQYLLSKASIESQKFREEFSKKVKSTSRRSDRNSTLFKKLSHHLIVKSTCYPLSRSEVSFSITVLQIKSIRCCLQRPKMLRQMQVLSNPISDRILAPVTI